MTLSELKSKFFTRPGRTPSTTIYVFDDEDSADSWIEDMYFEGNNRDYNLSCVVRSDMNAEYFLNERYCKAEIQQFYAVEPDVIAAVVEPYKGRKCEDKQSESFYQKEVREGRWKSGYKFP